MSNCTCLQMASKNVRGQKEEQNVGIITRRAGKKLHHQTTHINENCSSMRRSPRLADKAKPSQAIIAAKKNARLRQTVKKLPEVVIKDIYHTAREAKDMVRKQTGLVYDHRMSEHRCLWDSNYPECPERFTRVLERCEALGLVSRCLYIEPREATEKEILMKHSREQIEILKATSHCNDEEFLEELSSRYDAVYIHPSTYHLSLLATGSTIELVNAICSGKVQNGMAIIRPPGHHAMKSEYCGYCFFNNVAIAATHALTHCGVSRILIVDWDVHHGQATQQMFYDDPRVVYFSLHRYEHGSFWPNLRESDYDFIGEGAGAGYNFNVPLNNVGMTDADYLAVFHQILLPMVTEFQPELILVSAGYDAAIGCPEFGPDLIIVSAGYDSALGDEKGEMELTPACYAHLLNSLLCTASGKVAVVLEGGYCLQSLAEAAALTLRTLLGDPCPLLPVYKSPSKSICETIFNVIYAHREYWHCYQFQEKFSIHAEYHGKKIAQHTPTIKFLGTEEKQEKFETRNCYPVQSKEFTDNTARRLNLLIANTKLTFAPHQVCLVYDERMLKHKNIADPGHPERPERISAIYSRHEEYGLVERCHILKARSVSDEELLLLHTEEHVNMMRETANMKLRDLVKKQEEYRSVYLHPGSYQAACLSAGSVLQVVDSVLNGECRSGIAIVRPPGHHAEEDEPCGFCVFNNVSLAAKYAIEVHSLKRVLLLDWDVHHGNGSQHMFESDPRVLYLSLHRYDNGSFFPASTDANYNVVGSGKGEGFTVNIPWNKSGMTAIDYLTAFYQIVLPISYQFNPELVLVSAGFDACIGDPLGGCKVSPEAYGHFTHLLTSLAGGRVILSLEGGYNIASISHAMPMCTKALLGDPLPPLPARQIVCPSAVNSIKNVIRTHSKYWSALCFQVALPAENIFAKRSLDKTDVKVEIDDKVIVDVKSQDDTLTKITEKGNEKTDVIKIVDLPDSNLWVDNRNLEDLNLKGTAKSDENLVMVTRSPNNENVTPATIDIVSLENSLSNLSISETTTSSPDSVSYKDLSHDTSTSSSEMSKTKFDTDNTAKTLQESISPIKLSSCNERAIIEGDFQHKLRKVGDSNKDSSGEKSQQSDGQEGASGTSSSSGDATGQQTLVDYLSENMQSILAGEMFAVVPLRSCPHLNRVQPVPSNGIDCNSPCVDCGSPQENWVCLICYSVCCGRYVNEHMMIHGVENSHPLTLSFSDLSVWCYECEAYIDNHVLYAAKNAVHRSKFGEDMPWSYGDQMTMQLHE